MNFAYGTLVSFDAGSFTATVRLRGSAAQALAGVATSRAIAAVEMVAGRSVLVSIPPGGGPSGAMLIAVTT